VYIIRNFSNAHTQKNDKKRSMTGNATAKLGTENFFEQQNAQTDPKKFHGKRL